MEENKKFNEKDIYQRFPDFNLYFYKNFNSDLNNLSKEYSLSKNEVLSALRCIALLNKLQNELNMQATKYLSQSDSKKFIDKLEEAIGKAKIEIAGNKIRIKDFK
jgi:hypothetical protein